MATNREVIDCRWFLADIPCDIAISGNEEAVLNLAIQHAVESRGFRDTPALREQLRSMLRDDSQMKEIRGAVSVRAASG
jgi:hypothetical protein